MEGLRLARGPVGLKLDDRVRLPWNPFRLGRLSVCVELLPAFIVRLVVGLLRLKSVAIRVN